MIPYNGPSNDLSGMSGGGQPHMSMHLNQMMQLNIGQKRYAESDAALLLDDSPNDRPMPKKKGRKKSFIWAHVITDEYGKVHCKHCGALIRVNYGEKVERLRRHFIKNCPKSPFSKDSKEYEELLESVSQPTSDKRKSYIPQGERSAVDRPQSLILVFIRESKK